MSEPRKIVLPTQRAKTEILVKDEAGLVTPREILVEVQEKISDTLKKMEGHVDTVEDLM